MMITVRESDHQSFLEQEPLQEPLAILDLEGDGTHKIHELHSADQVSQCLDENKNYALRVISISQSNSWQPLQLTKSMADTIATHHRLSPGFWNILSCFYERHDDDEASFVVPFYERPTRHVADDDDDDDDRSPDCPPFAREASYSIRYPEQKRRVGGEELTWVMRQSAVLLRRDPSSSQSVAVIVNPFPGSPFWQAVVGHVSSLEKKDGAIMDLDWFHSLLFTTYMPSWRRYIASTEEEVSRIADNVITTYIDEPLDHGHDALNSLADFEARCLRSQTILEATSRQLDDIVSYLGERHGLGTLSREVARSELQFHRRQCTNHAGTAALLRQRAQMTNQFLANSLSFRDQSLSKEQNRNMLRLSKSAVFVTSLTLVYLPASYIASFFGMNFFDMDESSGRMIVNPMIWIYVLSTAFLSCLTYTLYYLVIHHDGFPGRRLKSKMIMSMKDFRARWRTAEKVYSSGNASPV